MKDQVDHGMPVEAALKLASTAVPVFEEKHCRIEKVLIKIWEAYVRCSDDDVIFSSIGLIAVHAARLSQTLWFASFDCSVLEYMRRGSNKKNLATKYRGVHIGSNIQKGGQEAGESFFGRVVLRSFVGTSIW